MISASASIMFMFNLLLSYTWALLARQLMGQTHKPYIYNIVVKSELRGIQYLFPELLIMRLSQSKMRLSRSKMRLSQSKMRLSPSNMRLSQSKMRLRTA